MGVTGRVFWVLASNELPGLVLDQASAAYSGGVILTSNLEEAMQFASEDDATAHAASARFAGHPRAAALEWGRP